MLTYEKTRYGPGDKLELLPRCSKPPPRTFSTVNAWYITSIATRLGQTGSYSNEEEEEEARKEREMVHPSFKYGAAVNLDARPDPAIMDQAKRAQIKAFKKVRDMSVYGESTVHSALTSLSAFLHEPDNVSVPSMKPVPKPTKKSSDPKEKITSNLQVLGDTGSSWSSVASGTSMATTTGTMMGSVKTITPLRKRLNDRLEQKGKMKSIPKMDEISSKVDSYEEPDEISSGSSTIGANQARLDDIMDHTLEDIKDTVRKRPKALLLGKFLPFCFRPTLKENFTKLKFMLRYLFPEHSPYHLPTAIWYSPLSSLCEAREVSFHSGHKWEHRPF